jgi:hypothetical protein
MNKLELTHPGIKKRGPFMHKMHRKFPTTAPESVSVLLEGGLDMVCIRFPFPSIFQDHLLHPLYGDLNDLVVNANDPWARYSNKSGTLFQEMRDGIYKSSLIPFRDSSYNPSYNLD